eukprot:2453027-Rhodomonas_salina.2
MDRDGEQGEEESGGRRGDGSAEEEGGGAARGGGARGDENAGGGRRQLEVSLTFRGSESKFAGNVQVRGQVVVLRGSRFERSCAAG